MAVRGVDVKCKCAAYVIINYMPENIAEDTQALGRGCRCSKFTNSGAIIYSPRPESKTDVLKTIWNHTEWAEKMAEAEMG